MCKIRMHNFGQVKRGFIEDEGWIEIKKVTLFIGNQSIGKSSISKLISIFIWIEKALTRGDYTPQGFIAENHFREIYYAYNRV